MATTDLQVKALSRKPGMHRVAPGLYLRVRESGAAFWALRYAVGGKAREMGLGSYPTVSLMEAGSAGFVHDASSQPHHPGQEPRRDVVDGTDGLGLSRHARRSARPRHRTGCLLSLGWR